jgi:nucleoside diphosphate kinase
MSTTEKQLQVTLAKMGIVPVAPEKSLETFYQVRDSVRRPSKQVYGYTFNDPIHTENGLIIVPITDVHLGSRHANLPYFKAFVNYIMSVPNCVTVLNGDLAETATKVSVGAGMFEEEMPIPEQLSALYQILKPLADAGKILGCGPGNHEERVYQLIGINPMEMLAEKLGVPYFGYQGFFKITVNNIPYTASFYHGSGGGSTNASKTGAAEKMNKVVLADLYFSGHTHGRQFHKDVLYTFSPDSNELVPFTRTYVVGGSFLEYWGGYSEMKALAPSITGAVRIELRPDVKDIRVIM